MCAIVTNLHYFIRIIKCCYSIVQYGMIYLFGNVIRVKVIRFEAVFVSEVPKVGHLETLLYQNK